MASPFASSTFRKFKLVFRRPGSSLVIDSATGLERIADGSPVVVLATLQGSSSPLLRMMLGLNEMDQALTGRLVEPTTLPDGVTPGATAPLTVDWISGTFTLGPRWPGAIPAVDKALGDRIIGSWRAASS